MLNDVFLKQFDELVGATTYPSQRFNCVTDLVKPQVAIEAFINELFLDSLPEFIVLKLHVACALDEVAERFRALAIESGELLLNQR